MHYAASSPPHEPRFVNCQYAYGRIRRTEFHAAELRSFLRGDSSSQPGIRGRLLPRRRLFKTLDRPHIGPHLLRFINKWLSDGRFRLRLIARNGQHLSARRAIPQRSPSLAPDGSGFRRSGSLGREPFRAPALSDYCARAMLRLQFPAPSPPTGPGRPAARLILRNARLIASDLNFILLNPTTFCLPNSLYRHCFPSRCHCRPDRRSRTPKTRQSIRRSAEHPSDCGS